MDEEVKKILESIQENTQKTVDIDYDKLADRILTDKRFTDIYTSINNVNKKMGGKKIERPKWE